MFKWVVKVFEVGGRGDRFPLSVSTSVLCHGGAGGMAGGVFDLA